MIYLFFIFLPLSFLCTLTSTLVASISPALWRLLNQNLPRRAKKLNTLLQNYSAFIAAFTLLNIGTLIANVLLAHSIITKENQISVIGAIIALFLLILTTVIFPKILALKSPLLSLKLVSPFLPTLTPILYLLKKLFEFIKVSSLLLPPPLLSGNLIESEDFPELLELAGRHGIMSLEERNFITHILSLNKLSANEIMRYRSQLHFVYQDATLNEMIASAKKFKHNHLPVFIDFTENDISYILDTRKLLIVPTPDLTEALVLPSCVHKSINLLQLLQSLRQRDRGLAVVLDELGNTTGVVTTEDLIEEVVGTIRGEIPENVFTIKMDGRTRWSINASTQVDDLRHYFPNIKEIPDVQSIGGILLTLKEKLPEPHETIDYCGYKFTIESVQYGKIENITIESKKQ